MMEPNTIETTREGLLAEQPYIPVHGFLTSAGVIVDQTSQSFADQLHAFFVHSGFSTRIDHGFTTTFQALDELQGFSKTWKFLRYSSYLFINEFLEANINDFEYSSGKYKCSLDALFEGADNAEYVSHVCELRVNLLIKLQEDSNDQRVLITLDELDKNHTAKIIKHPNLVC